MLPKPIWKSALRPACTTSPLICFEDMFPHLARQAVRDDTDFLVNLTNDGWFGDSAEQWQHMASAVFRAVENGVPLVRCCNNGVTCWIDRPRPRPRNLPGQHRQCLWHGRADD